MNTFKLLKKFKIELVIHYSNCPRNGKHSDIILDEYTASLYYDHFGVPSEKEATIIEIKSY